MINAGIYPSYAKDYVFTDYNNMVNAQMVVNVIVSILIFLFSPPLGALTDIMCFRVALTTISALLYSICTMLYYPIKKGSESLFMAMSFFTNFGFRISESVAGAYLPSICSDRDVGFVSAFGYFIGFVAGVIIILLFKLLVSINATGLTAVQVVKLVNRTYSTAMLTVGIIMLLSSVPPILMMNDGIPEGESRPKWQWSYIPNSFKQNFRTYKTAFTKENKVLALVLIDYAIMSIPIQALGNYVGALMVEFGADYGVTRDLWQTGLLVYNAGVAIFSLIYGLLSKWVSAKILVSIAYCLLIISSFYGCIWESIPYDLEKREGPNPGLAWMWLGISLMSCSMGPIQALMRGLIGLLANPEQKNEIFGVLESMVIFGSLLGSTIPGFMAKMGPWQFNLFEIVFFLAGFVLFLFIPVMKAEREAHERARRAAAEAEAAEAAEEEDDESESSSGSSSPSPSASESS